jgi:hypothetical protein
VNTRFEPPGPCPVCGEDVPPGVRACPGCGSCHGTGWSEEAAYDSLDLPDDTFDYEEYVEREFAGRKEKGRSPAWWIVLGTIALLLIWLLAR